MEASLQALVKEYQALNRSTVVELNHTPTPLEFSRFVAANRPVVIRGQGQREGIQALERWDNEYLVSKVEGEVAIAVSPEGNADAIVDDKVFVEPATVQLTLADFLLKLDRPTPSPPPSLSTSLQEPVNHLQSQSSNLGSNRTPLLPQEPAFYLQSQSSNLGSPSSPTPLTPLLADLGSSIAGPSFAREVFETQPDATNLWIGDQRSVTSLHKDPYENLYLVIRGVKEFVLLPPTEFYCLHEQPYPHATYSYTPTSTPPFSIIHTTPPLTLPWIPVDPVNPNLALYPRFAHARALHVRLEKGDMLYLPAMWFHRVAQDVGPPPWPSSEMDEQGEELRTKQACIAVNWWFDMDMSSPLWSFCGFLRRETLRLDGRVDEAEEE